MPHFFIIQHLVEVSEEGTKGCIGRLSLMMRCHFGKIRTALGLSAHFASLGGSSASCDTNSLPWQFPIIMVSRQGKNSSITLPSGMKYIIMGFIPSTLLTTEIAHPSIAPLLNTIYKIIYIPIPLIVASLLEFTLASDTASTATPTICVLFLGLINFCLVMRMQAIWRVVFTTTIITWDFSFLHSVPMFIWNVPMIGSIKRVEGVTL